MSDNILISESPPCSKSSDDAIPIRNNQVLSRIPKLSDIMKTHHLIIRWVSSFPSTILFVQMSKVQQVCAVHKHNNSSILRLYDSISKASHIIHSIRKAHYIDTRRYMCHHVMRVKVSSKNTSIKPLYTDYHAVWALFIRKPVAYCKFIKHVCAAIQVLAIWYLYNRKQSILRKPHSSTQQCSLIRREVNHSSRKLFDQSICDKIITSVLNIFTDVDNFGVLVHCLRYNSCHVFPHNLSLLTFPPA
mmetsp:Transcript_15261/g.32812  ORF Transcript_15261/g.32812 Transcript_15261/m.32812 type:complete len:246 (+) Transcript_15261:243-980(+)